MPDDFRADVGEALCRKSELPLRRWDRRDLEAAVGRRIVGYRERLRSRMPTKPERARRDLPTGIPVLEMWRIARSTTTPVSAFRFIARPDRFEADYLIDK